MGQRKIKVKARLSEVPAKEKTEIPELTTDEALSVRRFENLELRAHNTLHEARASMEVHLTKLQNDANQKSADTKNYLRELAATHGLDPEKTAFDFGALKFINKQ